MFLNLDFFVYEIEVIIPTHISIMSVTLKDLTYAKHLLDDKCSIKSGYNVHRINV